MTPGLAPQLLTLPVSARDHALGLASAPVTLVEYGDFECPHCAAAAPVVRGLLASLGGRLRFVFRHFPITLRHDHAQKAAEASEAAAAQGRFWEMHDLLFRHQEELDPTSLIRYAGELGLDVARFENELRRGVHADAVYEHMAGGEGSGVTWTPTFFLNGVRYGVARDLDGLVEAVTAASAPRAR